MSNAIETRTLGREERAKLDRGEGFRESVGEHGEERQGLSRGAVKQPIFDAGRSHCNYTKNTGILGRCEQKIEQTFGLLFAPSRRFNSAPRRPKCPQ